MVELSLILPACNEKDFLENSIKKIEKHLKKFDYEILIAEDGSTDGTDRIARAISRKNKKIRHIHHDEKLGRGLALKKAIEKCKGKTIAYMDVDLATSPKYLPTLLSHAKKFDVVTGSRYTEKGRHEERPLLRLVLSHGYNLAIRSLLGADLKDSQCGFKAFSKKFCDEVISNINEKSWAWDTVVLVEAKKQGFSVKEFGVNWKEMKEKSHSGSLRRNMKDIKIHGSVLFKLFLRWRLKLPLSV